MTIPVRRAEISLQYNSADISADVAPYLLAFDYSDVFNSKSTDDLHVVVEDKDDLWKTGWFPQRGAKLRASLTCHDWPGGKVLDCGSFEIDSIESIGPPNICVISALAVGITSSIRRQKVSKAWENITFGAIAAEVAGKHGFELVYVSTIDPQIDRFDQREQTDMEMLGQLCDNHGFGIKATDGKLLIYEEAFYDTRAPEVTFTRNANGYKNHRLCVSSTDVYSACEVQYIDPKQRLLIKYTYKPEAGGWQNEPPPSGHILKINQRCTCEAEAERLAKSALRDQNKQEVPGTLVMLGDPGVRSGFVSNLVNYGKFDNGTYMIEKARHRYDKKGGYVTTAELRGTLVY